MSAPVVAGVAALVKTRHPDWSPEMIRQQLRWTGLDLEPANPGYEGRIGGGMVQARSAVAESVPGVHAVDLRIYIEQIVSNLSRAYLVLPERIDVKLHVEELDLDLDRALACGLIVNELMTNALKHAFAEDEPGEITISCRGDEGKYVLEVSDNGPGYDGDAGGGDDDSLGLSLVRTLVSQLQGELHFDGRSGASYHIEFPVRSPREVVA